MLAVWLVKSVTVTPLVLVVVVSVTAAAFMVEKNKIEINRIPRIFFASKMKAPKIVFNFSPY